MIAPGRLVGVCAVAVLAVAGCRGAGPSAKAVPTVNMAGGFYLELQILGRENFAVLYRVNGKRQLGFGGGLDAVNQTISWAGRLTEQEYSDLHEQLEINGWFAGTVTSTGQPPKRVTRFNLYWPGGHRRFKGKGESSQVEPVEALLSQASRRRLDKDLQLLPEPGPQPVDR